MTKITKVWFDENLGEMQQEEIPSNRIWLTAEELAAAAELNGSIETTMRLTCEELAERFGVTMIKEPAKPEIWYGVDFAQPGSDRTVAWHGGRQVGKALVLADIQRAIDSLNDPQPHPYHMTADLYDRMQAEGMALGGVTRIEPASYEFQRPPAAAKTSAALHPLVRALIDNFNKEI